VFTKQLSLKEAKFWLVCGMLATALWIKSQGKA